MGDENESFKVKHGNERRFDERRCAGCCSWRFSVADDHRGRDAVRARRWPTEVETEAEADASAAAKADAGEAAWRYPSFAPNNRCHRGKQK
jgi:hypothetical protein